MIAPEDAEQPSHARYERNFLFDAPFDQAFVVLLMTGFHRIAESGTVLQSVANISAATGNGSLAAHLPRVRD